MHRTFVATIAAVLLCGLAPTGVLARAASTRRAEPASLESAIQQVLRRATSSVVRVWFGEDDLITGTIISDEGLVLTCAHLPAPVGETVQIGFSDGRKAPARVLAKLPEPGQGNLGRDLALLQISEPGAWTSAPVAESSPTSADAQVLAMGFPDTLLYGPDRSADPLYVRLGRPIRNPYAQSLDELTTSIFGSGGDSGGPLFDLAGRLIGVVHGGDASGAHLSFTRVEVLRRHWAALAPGWAAPRVPPAPELEPPGVAAHAPLVAACEPARQAAVEIHSQARWIGLGCVVGDGLILTKASELGPNLTVLLPPHFVAIAEVAATDPARDLALLRLPYAPEVTKGIRPVVWEGGADLPAGTPVVLAAPRPLEPLVGVTCFEARPVPRIAGAIPCELEQFDGGLRVTRIANELRAHRLRPPPLPLRVGDVLLRIEGQDVPDLAALATLAGGAMLGQHPSASGEPVRVAFRRGDRALEETVVLEFAATPSTQLVRPASNRYSSFPRALATDLPVRPEHCGGPVADSRGKAVGLLIARAPFIESLVIPAGEVAASLRAMMESSGIPR